MKDKYFKLLMPVLICTAGCATETRVTRLEQIGPDPALTSPNAGAGFLQVFSARERVPIDVNAEEFFENNDYGKNEFLHYPAHTSYTIHAPDGHLLQRVRNATEMNDASPTIVALAPGFYELKAVAEDYSYVTLPVTIPVHIEPGLTTAVHLDGGWNPAIFRKQDNEMVCLPNGHVVGWRSPKTG